LISPGLSRMMLRLAVAAAVLAVAVAECPNACSGNGDCQNKDQCQCYDGFFGGDCSLRICPLASAFVDIPRGDLNHDGRVGYYYPSGDAASSYSKVQWSRYRQYEAWPTVAKTGGDPFSRDEVDGIDVGSDHTNVVGGWAAQVGEAHFMLECSGKGVCDRQLGVCRCYDGYTGGACQRTACPADCSGHGLCRTVREIAVRAYNKKFVESAAGVNYYSGITSPYEYRLWDADQNSACVCDVGYTGIDCSMRECPKGDDPLTTTKATCGGRDCKDEMQSFSVDGSQLIPGTYYLVMRDYTGVTFKTDEFSLYTDSFNDADWETHNTANLGAVKTALETLPNNLTGAVMVTSSGGGKDAKDQYRMTVTFAGKSGNVPEMTLGWTGTSNPNTRRAYVFQPGQPVQSTLIPSDTGPTAYLKLSVYPQDPALYGLEKYWESKCIEVAVSNTPLGEADVADGVAEALNSIAAVKLSYGRPFIRDANVVAQYSAGDAGYNVRIAFPDKQFGLSKIFVDTFSDDACTTSTTSGEGQPISVFGDVIDGNKEHTMCSNRGLCDYTRGLCSCFTGYTGVACEIQSTLAS